MKPTLQTLAIAVAAFAVTVGVLVAALLWATRPH